MTSKKVVVIGGGHGQAIILRGIKSIPDIDIVAIVTVADDGGSTGRIRHLYNIPAMGDVRNVLLALSTKETNLTSLLDYRFTSNIGDGDFDIIGHNLGNLIFTALSETCGSFMGAIEKLSDALAIRGKVYPSSLDLLTLYAKMDDDTIVKGEANIPSYNHHIKEVFYQRTAKATDGVVDAILEADLVIYGIGSVYTSIIPNIIIPEIKEALKKTKAYKVYFANCMTQNNETFDYDLKDHVVAMQNHGTIIDLIVKHADKIPEDILRRYRDENSIEVIDHNDTGIEVISRDLLIFDRDLVRHDPCKIEKVVIEILNRCK